MLSAIFTVPTERCVCWQEICASARVYVGREMYDYETENKRLEAPIFAYTCVFTRYVACQLSSKSSMSFTFIYKVKDLNRVHWQVHVIISALYHIIAINVFMVLAYQAFFPP